MNPSAGATKVVNTRKGRFGPGTGRLLAFFDALIELSESGWRGLERAPRDAWGGSASAALARAASAPWRLRNPDGTYASNDADAAVMLDGPAGPLHEAHRFLENNVQYLLGARPREWLPTKVGPYEAVITLLGVASIPGLTLALCDVGVTETERHVLYGPWEYLVPLATVDANADRVAQLPRNASAFSSLIDDYVPDEVRGALQEAGVVLIANEPSASIDVSRAGTSFAKISTNPPAVQWRVPAFGEFLHQVMVYRNSLTALGAQGDADLVGGLLHGMRDRLRHDRAAQQRLRDSLRLDALLGLATLAQLTMRARTGPVSQETYLSHPALGEFMSVTVRPGQATVDDLAFASPQMLAALQILVRLEEYLVRARMTR